MNEWRGLIDLELVLVVVLHHHCRCLSVASVIGSQDVDVVTLWNHLETTHDPVKNVYTDLFATQLSSPLYRRTRTD